MPFADDDLRSLLMVPPGGPVDLAAIDPRGTPGLPEPRKVRRKGRKAWSRAKVARIGVGLAEQQEMLYAGAKVAGDRRRVLLVLQAMDCGGKDGTVKKVVGAMDPLGLHIAAFGPPTSEELAHDFLWRVRRALPPPGYIGVFNRSHYEDVLIARVNSLVPKRTWQARYDAINRFERDLVDDGVTLVKVLLHISYQEQGQRLLERLDDPTKHWKYNPDDLAARARWHDYQAAYADALSRCGTDYAPWFVVPADRKWYRNWAVARILRETLRDLRLRYPAAGFDVTRERERLAAVKLST